MKIKQDELIAKLEKRCGESRQSGTGFYNFARCAVGNHRKKWTFGVNPNTMKWSCFACSKSGRLKDLKGFADVTSVTHTGRVAPEWSLAQRKVLPEGYELPWVPLSPYGSRREFLEEEAIRYLEQRGVDIEHAANLGVGYGVAGKWVGYVIFPWWDDDGNLAGWQGRLCGDPDEESRQQKVETTSPRRQLPNGKWVGDGEFVIKNKMGGLGGLERVVSGQMVLAVEGPFDYASASRVMPTVWMQGGLMFPAQMKRLRKAGVTGVIWGHDPDKYDEAFKMARKYHGKMGMEMHVIDWGDYAGDWADDEDGDPLVRPEVEALLKLARPFRPGE